MRKHLNFEFHSTVMLNCRKISDMPDTACYAATELDNLILGRSEKRDEIGKLVNKLRKAIPDGKENVMASYDVPRTVLVWQAMRKVYGDGAIEHKTPLFLAQAQRVIDQLDDVYQKNIPDQNQLKYLRSFCLEMSRNGSSW